MAKILKIYNETDGEKSGKSHILVMDSGTARDLPGMLEFAADKNRRRRTWQTLRSKIYDSLECF